MNAPDGAAPQQAGQRREAVPPRRAKRGPGRSLLGPVRLRLALLVLIAAIPLLALSATIVLQNYHLALKATAETAAGLREAAVARHVATISSAEQLLEALAQDEALTGAGPSLCHTHLASILSLQSARYSNIAVTDPHGIFTCSALAALKPGPANLPGLSALLADTQSRRRFTLGPVQVSPLTGYTVLPTAYPILRGHEIVAFLLATIRVDWFAKPESGAPPSGFALWLSDSTGKMTPVTSGDSPGLPSAPLLRRLQAASLLSDGPSASFMPCAYASALLGDGYRLIVAYPAAADQQAAMGLLIRRIGQLGLLLLLGLAAVAIGTHLALVEPMDQLSQAVAHWRRGGRFDASALRDPPNEIREMAETFAEAIAAIADHAARHQLAVGQQELLMREIHHRVKNNLQIVASLLNLQASRIRLPEARAEFASARDRVRALATLHRHLYLQGEVHTIDMPSFLTELCNQLFQAMGETPGRRIALTIEASPLQMSSDQAVPLSLIVTEAVSNAVKYAFPGGRNGHVSVKLTSDGKTADLVVSDDGVGIPAGKIETETGTRDGIGISLIRGFARQLNATLTITEDRGTSYAVHISLGQEPTQTDLAA